MKELYLDAHLKNCKNSNNQFNYCKTNPSRFLFFLGGKFFIITYHECLEEYDRYSFFKNLIASAIDNVEEYKSYEINTGVKIAKELKEFREKNRTLRNYIYQVHYTYKCAAGIEYAIATKTNFIDFICSNETIKENYIESKKFLKDNNFEYLITQLDSLYYYNTMWDAPKAEYHKTIEHIIKSINNN